MTEEQWELLDELPGTIEVEILRGLLEAQEIPVVLSQEGAGRAIGLTIGPLGETQVLVPKNKLEEAKKVLDQFYAEIKGGNSASEEKDS